MELIYLALAGGALYWVYNMGADRAHEVLLERQLSIVNRKFEGFDNFRMHFGIPGLFLSDIHPQHDGSLIIIELNKLIELSANKKFLPYISDDELENEKNRIRNKWLTEAKGMDKETIEFLDEING